VKLVPSYNIPSYNISEVKFTIYNTIVTLLHHYCQQINMKTEEWYCLHFLLKFTTLKWPKLANPVSAAALLKRFKPQFKPLLSKTCEPYF